jgi:DNA replication protein DnaC
MGKQYHDEVILDNMSDIRWALDTDEKCPACDSMDRCPMEPKGYQLHYCHDVADKYQYPMFAVSFCMFLRQQQNEIKETDHPDIYKGADFNHLKVTHDNKAAYDYCYAYAMSINRKTRKGLYLTGNEGTGKTALAYAVMRQANRIGLPCAFVKVTNILSDLRQSYKNDYYEPVTYFRAMEKHFVILDDLGVERPTDWVREQIYNLIDARYVKGLPTVITTNFTIKELEERLGSDDIVVGQRITGRINEMCDVVPVTGKSWRRRKA